MTVETTIYDTLKGLVDGGAAKNPRYRIFPDVAPVGTLRPYITFQQVGGAAINFLDQATVPSKKRSRFQISIWGDTRTAVAALAIQVEDALRVVAALQTTVEGAPVVDYEQDTKLFGSRQDFSFIA